jgi:hypothetical protein
VSDVPSTDQESAASALGSFLQNLMTSLHEQGNANGPPANSAGAPGRLAEDLQSLIASLQGDSSAGGTASALQSSFSSLLEAFGADSSDAQSRLAGFLQSLADQLPPSGSSGNLVNTTA